MLPLMEAPNTSLMVSSAPAAGEGAVAVLAPAGRPNTSLMVSSLIAVGVAVLLAGVSILAYSAITAAAIPPSASVTWWVHGIPQQGATDPLATINDVFGDRRFSQGKEMPGRVVAAWGCVLVVVGGGVTAFGLSARPRVRAGR